MEKRTENIALIFLVSIVFLGVIFAYVDDKSTGKISLGRFNDADDYNNKDWIIIEDFDIRESPGRSCGYHFAGAYTVDVSRGPIQGMRSNIEVIRQGGSTLKSAWISLKVTDYWYQLGYKADRPSPFAMCFQSGGGVCRNLNVTYLDNYPVLEHGTFATFSIQNIGGTIWRTSVNGINISDIDFRGTTILPGTAVGVMIEEGYTCNPGNYRTIEFSPALDLYESGSWAPARYARSEQTEPIWGVEGHLQNPSLNDNELRMGSSIPIPPGGTLLWNITQECFNDNECSDNNLCNGIEICNAGTCQNGTALTCDDGNICNGAETCDPINGCQAGTPLVCNDGNQCTADSCNPQVGCGFNVLPDRTVCNDGDRCTVSDRCQAGACHGTRTMKILGCGADAVE